MTTDSVVRIPRCARALGIAVITTLMVVACGGSTAPTAKYGGTLRLGYIGAADSANPFVTENLLISAPAYSYPRLIQYDSHSHIVGDFAKTWTFSADSLTVTFHTYAGAKWSDGSPLTTSDVAFTFNDILLKHPDRSGLESGHTANIASTEAPDPSTFVIHLKNPAASLLADLTFILIVPEKVWAQYAAGDGSGLDTFAATPPGVYGGPLMLTKFSKDIILWDRNPNYYAPRAFIDHFGVQYFGTLDAAFAALKTHEIDVIDLIPEFNGLASLKQSGLIVNAHPSPNWTYLNFNSNPKKPANRELLDPKVRDAFAHAIDYQNIIKTVYIGDAVTGSVITPGDSWLDPNVKVPQLDYSLANQELDSLGYAKGSDGIRTANGHKMDYVVNAINSPDALRTLQLIQNNWQNIGVKVTIKPLDSGALFNAEIAPGGQYLTSDIAFWGWFDTPDPGYILSVVLCSQYGNLSDSGYCNPDYDKIWQQQSSTVDPAQRHQLVNQLQEILATDRPYIPLVFTDEVTAYSPSWTGFQFHDVATFAGYALDITSVHRV